MLETVPARVREEAEGGPEDTEELEAVVGRIGPGPERRAPLLLAPVRLL